MVAVPSTRTDTMLNWIDGHSEWNRVKTDLQCSRPLRLDWPNYTEVVATVTTTLRKRKLICIKLCILYITISFTWTQRLILVGERFL